MNKAEFERRVQEELEKLRIREAAIRILVAEGYDEASLREED